MISWLKLMHFKMRYKRLSRHLSLFSNYTEYQKIWDFVQNNLAPLRGAQGVALRQKYYPDFFLNFGQNVSIDADCYFTKPEFISLADGVRFNEGSLVYGSGGLAFGRNVLIGPKCFFHTANHHLSTPSIAAIESGFEYHSVEVGDNSLISANVSMMPAAKLGEGSFVACGALVPGKSFPDHAKLMGLPAKVVPEEKAEAAFQETPVIAFLVKTQLEFDKFKLLLSYLRTPQARIFYLDEALPDSIKMAISLYKKESLENNKDIRFWHMTHGQEEDLFDNLSFNHHQFQLQSSKTIEFAPTFNKEGHIIENALSLHWYYFSKRYAKRALSPQEQSQIHLLLFILEKLNEKEKFKLLVSFIQKNLADFELLKDYKTIQPAMYPQSLALKEKNDIKLFKAVYLAPDIVLDPQYANKIFSEIPTKNYDAVKRTDILQYMLLHAYLMQNEKMIQLFKDKLLSEDFICYQTGLFFSSTKSSGFAYTPMSIISALLLANLCKVSTDIKFTKSLHENIKWQAFSKDTKDKYLIKRGKDHTSSLVDESNQLLSISLLENLVKDVAVPHYPNHCQLEINSDCYKSNVYALEELWIHFLKSELIKQKSPFLRISPWPASYKNAVSIRYDIDRKTHPAHVRKILDVLKTQHCGKAATWFKRIDEDTSEPIDDFLQKSVQDIAYHLVNSSDAIKDKGSTMHSGPNSEYWQGAKTILNSKHSLYAEQLQTQLNIPRHAWVTESSSDNHSGHATTQMLLPLHFPLEGGTSDDDLSYFNKQRLHFDALLQKGGHVIIGSHPDLNQDILKTLLSEKGRFKHAWFANITEVVNRVKKVSDYGNIGISYDEKAGYRLLSKNSVADLCLQVYDNSHLDEPKNMIIQANANAPRQIEIN